MWLSANAQPRLTAALYIFLAIVASAAGLVSTLIAIYAHPLAWAVAALSAGIIVSVVVYSVASVRTPPDLD